MNQFKPPRIGSNVVHRIDVSDSSRKRRNRRRRGTARVDEPEAGRVPLPAAPPESRRRAPEPHPREPLPLPIVAPRPEALEDSQARKQIQLLERRLAKMARLIDDRDAVVAAAAATAARADEGVPSIYTEVQGIQGRGKEVKQKKALMSAIFEANLQLRGGLSGA